MKSPHPLALWIVQFGLLFLPALALAGFETGTVSASNERLFQNGIPQVARLGNGQLFTVWCAKPKTGAALHIFGAFSADGGRTWSEPKLLISDAVKEDGDPNLLVDGNRVLLLSSRCATPNKIDKSWIMMRRSEDNGQTWSPLGEIFVPRQYLAGKQANGIVLRDGTYLMGISWDKWPEIGLAAKSEGEMYISTVALVSMDGEKWTLHGAIHATYDDKVTPGGTNGLAEPSVVELADGSVLMLLRSGASHHYESRSDDSGLTWSKPVPSALPGHNTPSALWRLDENPREIVVVWNNSPLARYPLSTALSADGGRTWSAPRIVARTPALQVSYPGLTQAADHTLVAVWQQARPNGGRDIRWARFTRDWVLGIGDKN